LTLWRALAHSHIFSETHITRAPHLARFWYFIHRTMDEGSIDIQDVSCYVFWYCQSLVTESCLTFYTLHRNRKVKKKVPTDAENQTQNCNFPRTLSTSWAAFPAPTQITSGPAIETSALRCLASATCNNTAWRHVQCVSLALSRSL